MPSIVSQLSTAARDMTSFLKNGCKDADSNLAVMAFVVLLIYAVPLELGQFVFAVVGSLCYVALQASRKMTHSKVIKSDKSQRCKIDDDYKTCHNRAPKPPPRGRGDAAAAKKGGKRDENPAGRQEYRQESSHPVSAPTFSSNDFEAQVSELVCQIAPSQEGDKVVQDIVSGIKQVLSSWIPQADVMGFASGDVLRGTAFAVAIPEVDIILSANPRVFVDCLQKHSTRPLHHASRLNACKLQKAMLRACTDSLTSSPGFKFRRSFFKGLEPKVTLMVERSGRTVPIGFSVNTVDALHNAALLTECGQIEPRAKELILLVRRWAKDRGISHAAKGHLCPYSWSLLVIYFLQVWDGHQPHVLPSITAFKMSSCLLRQQQKANKANSAGACAGQCGVSVAVLFKEFVRFYAQSFNWRDEAVSVRAGARQALPTCLPLHIVTLENGATDVALSVQDPFQPKRNLGDAMTGVTLRRLREELARANQLCSQDATLGQVIEPWVPPERDAAPHGAPARSGHDDDEADGCLSDV